MIRTFKKITAPTLSALSAAVILSSIGQGVLSSPAHAASAAKLDTEVSTSLKQFTHEIHDADTILKQAKAILVFPSVYQGGIMVGGQYGEGALLLNGQTEGYYNMISASYGLQFGGQKKTVILAFMTDEALAGFHRSEGWKIGADASVALVKVGAEGSIDSATLNKPVVGFVIGQKGLMYNLSLEGSKITKINPQ